jgi:hypothetical protein
MRKRIPNETQSTDSRSQNEDAIFLSTLNVCLALGSLFSQLVLDKDRETTSDAYCQKSRMLQGHECRFQRWDNAGTRTGIKIEYLLQFCGNGRGALATALTPSFVDCQAPGESLHCSDWFSFRVNVVGVLDHSLAHRSVLRWQRARCRGSRHTSWSTLRVLQQQIQCHNRTGRIAKPWLRRSGSGVRPDWRRRLRRYSDGCSSLGRL